MLRRVGLAGLAAAIGAVALPGTATAGMAPACDPNSTLPARFCMLGDVALSESVATRPFELDLSFDNVSPQETNPNKNVWLNQAAVYLNTGEVPPPDITASDKLPNELLVAGEPLTGATCTSADNFVGCEAGHGTIIAEVTNSPGGFGDGTYSGQFGIHRIYSIDDVGGTETLAHYRVEAEGCATVNVAGRQCASFETDVMIPKPPPGDRIEFVLPTRFQPTVPAFPSATVDLAISSATVHIDRTSSTLRDGQPADRSYKIAKLPEECGTLDANVEFVSGDGRNITLPRPLEVTGCTTTSLRVTTPGDKVKASGKVVPAVDGGPVNVTLLRKKGQTFEEVKDKDVVTDVAGKYAAEFKAPNASKCRVIAAFEGDATHAPSEATKTFGCG